MAVKKITWRWLFNSFGVIVVIILVVGVLFAVGISSYYYTSVRQTLKTQADLINSEFSRYYSESVGEAGFTGRVRDFVSNFSAKEKMELMTIDSAGGIIFTSSGFPPDDTGRLPDYEDALSAGTGEFVGEISGQRVMAISQLSTASDESLSAVRLVASLEKVDRQIVFWIVCVGAFGVLVLLLVLFSSSYFISSIVNPVGEVSQTAQRIANGDFEAHLEKKNDDEIGELCDTINYMAGKLGEAERMKNDFISSVSHELRTPLTAIQGWGETLLADDGTDKEMLGRGMGIIISETHRLSRMVEELLDFSRMQSGRLQLDMGRVDALAELSDVVLMYTERAKRDNKALIYNDSELIVPVMGDKNRLRQVFVNIIDNAVKYTDPGNAIAVSARVEDKTLLMQVEDNGIGIRSEDLPRVKTKFFKADSTRRSSGIGLAVADEIIAQHGGGLKIDSEYGRGTRVTITLPVHTPTEGDVG